MEQPRQRFKDAALLLVEDEVEAREMIARMIALNYPGIKIYAADDGRGGLELYRQYRPDVVVTDINMPQMNGIAMAREIKEIDPDATIVAVTAHSETTYLMNAIEIGMDHYVLKPVNYPELFRVLDRIGEKITLRRLVAQQVAALRASERRFSTIFQATPDLLSIASLGDLRLVEVNEAFLRVLGFDREEVIGRSTAELGLWLDAGQPEALLREVARTGVVRDLEVRIRGKSGQELEGLVSADSIDMDGSPFLLTLFKDISERKRLEQVIKHQAQHDTLTDLPNRKLFMDFLALELAQARRNRKSLAVLFLDLNHFKQINDTLGHAAGDLLLQSVAQRLKACVRESDTVARIGGDEFNVLMPDLAQPDDVGTVVNKIVGVFQAPFRLEGIEVKVGTSVGISMFPDDGDTCEELLQKADGAMYVAKQNRGSSYQFYNNEINARTLNRQNLERQLRQAVSRGELELLYQPLLNLGDGRIIAAEALLRWHHPERGLLLPEQFITVAEESGAIVPIGEWVIHHACGQVKKWQEKGFGLSLAVNLSNREFHQPHFLEQTLAALTETGIGAGTLQMDIPERAIMENGGTSRQNMLRLTEAGVAFSVDDFGVGSSSLQRIRQLPIAKLKIDRSFIRNLDNPDNLDVVTAMICMSHSLKLRVNAVGVERPEQLELMRTYGCDEVQGDLICRPLPAVEFERALARSTHGGVLPQ
ncbi:EAL domain-containing protein [Geomonas nitrogeniifigens]|uniref:EAL domain-containing protein n=1 Tax=Geomonas diazotrophica TaxID=2843197 RepID=A0ABX8JLY1_9BACT|nr:EAL domain-containing protein [Geomonas nitrogeniifigens]QWV99350.1 EAL domain-containing protein [Geomonas nitrogeniifigens]QXE88517.1 EAL domain-containing protein [Geomonas nitrogeniifigens]